MSSGSSLPYHLRPNKAVDRELFLGLLSRLAVELRVENYQYISLGGPFLEDFRLVHARLGINDLVCVEDQADVHERQKFNRPIYGIECVHSTLEEYIDSTDLEKPVVIWFDYTDPMKLTDQIERFCRTIADVHLKSVLRVTLNANPASLGNPDLDDKAARCVSGKRSSVTEKLQEWRLDRLREGLGKFLPSDLKPNGMTYKNYGKSLLKILHIAVERELQNHTDRCVIWALATHYADGQPMVTATIIVCSRAEETVIQALLKQWEFSSTPDAPLVLDMPALSILERLTMESCEDPKKRMSYDLPQTNIGEDPFESFKRFYRIFPHFSRVEF